MSKPYNGHRNYNAWNVSLWLHNDEDLYRAMNTCVKYSPTKKRAAQKMLDMLPDNTPDGVPYTLTNILLAMRDI